jgi:methylglyoxal synthase
MKQERVAAQISDGQLSLIFEPDRLDRMNEAARVKALLTLAQVLMQAAGLVVEELGDARR